MHRPLLLISLKVTPGESKCPTDGARSPKYQVFLRGTECELVRHRHAMHISTLKKEAPIINLAWCLARLYLIPRMLRNQCRHDIVQINPRPIVWFGLSACKGSKMDSHHSDWSQETWFRRFDSRRLRHSKYIVFNSNKNSNFNMKLFTAIVAGFLALASAQSSSPNASISLLEVPPCFGV